MAKSKAQVNWDYYKGNHLPYWNGQYFSEEARAKAKTNKEAAAIYDKELARIFHSYNVVRLIVKHYVNALVGQLFTWSLSHPTQENIPDEVTQIIKDWLDWQKKSPVKKGEDRGSAIACAVTQMLVCDNGDSENRDSVGSGFLRLYSPKRFRNLKEPYKRVILHCPRFGSIEPEWDEDDGTFYKCTYHFGKGKKEVYELLENGLTQITKADGTVETKDYGGYLPVFELREECLITDDLRRTQQALNKLLTSWDNNLDFAGFRERVIMNAMPPGKFIKDDNGKIVGFKRDENAKIGLGARSELWIQGVDLGDPNQPSGKTNPSVHYADPVDVINFVGSEEAFKADAYEIGGMGHMLDKGGDRISGKSRVEGKEDYKVDLGTFEEVIEKALEAVLSLLLLILSRESEYTGLNLDEYIPTVNLNININSPPEQREQDRADFTEGGMSLETFISRRGDGNPQSEISKIQEDAKKRLNYTAEEEKIKAEAKKKADGSPRN